MKTIEEWEGHITDVAANHSREYRWYADVLQAIRKEAFDAAIEAIDKCTFRGKDNRLRPTITFADAIKAIQELKEKK